MQGNLDDEDGWILSTNKIEEIGIYFRNIFKEEEDIEPETI